MKKIILILLFCFSGLILYAQKHPPKVKPAEPPAPYGPVPTPAQVEWQKMEMNLFCHFGPNTFTGLEWGEGTETEDIFNPTALDCNQWVSVVKNAGFQGVILTAKHHDGFCLWPNPVSTHTVRQSAWRNGKGDVLEELSEACKRGGVNFGIYISPWDRNAPTYGTEAYNKVFLKTLRSAHKHYGPIFEQWFDGANGEGPNGKRQVYDWERFNAQTLKLQPNAVIFSDVGPGCRWVGNEDGHAGETNWSRLGVKNGERKTENSGCGNVDGDRWIPAEVDVSIRPGWFWHAEEHPKTVNELMEIYFNSVGRNGLLLLNVPPDSRGRIPAEDSAVLVAFRAERDRIFSNDLTQGGIAHGTHLRGRRSRADNVLDTAYHTYWAASSTNDTLFISTPDPINFDIIMLQEYIPLGQRVAAFHVDCWQPWVKGGWVTIAKGTTIGYKRLLRIPAVTASRLRIIFDNVLATPVINRVALYNSNK